MNPISFRTSRTFLALLFFAVPHLLHSAGVAAVFCVSPSGSDTAPGTIAQPFASIVRAQQAVRNTARGGLKSDVVVFIREGTYRITEPLEFGPGDGGTAKFSVTYSAWPGERAVISGGRLLDQWTEQNGVWESRLPDSFAENGTIRELFVGGERMRRARQPNDGYFRIAKTGADRRTSFRFEANDVRNLPDLEAVELVFLHDWSISRVKISEVDESEQRLTLADQIGPSSPHFAIDHFEQHPRYFLENSRAFLDQPGEWQHDVQGNRLIYHPRPGEEIRRFASVVPVARRLLVVQSAEDADTPVRNLRFVGLHFEHCAWPIPANGYAAGQAGFHERRFGEGGSLRESIPAAISFERAENCRIERCQIAHLGNSAVWIGAACRSNSITDSVITDVSGNGIMIGEDRSRTVDGKPWWQRAPEQAAAGNAVRRCRIEHCGQQFFGAVGIWIGLAQYTEIAHNEIRHLPYTGISAGWMWNPAPTPCHHNQIEFNHIHHVMQVLSDGGGIYTLGRQPGTVLRKNFIHDVPLNLGRAESNGMFLDEGTTEIVIEKNLIYNTVRSPLRFHRASTNVVKRNRMVVPPGVPAVRYNNTKAEDIQLIENEVLSAAPEAVEALQFIRQSWP